MMDLFDSLGDGAELLVSVASSLPALAAIAAYVFLGLALTSLCRASERGRIWMAWVPFANLYLLGLMADVYTDTYFPTGVPGDPVDASPSTLRRKILGFSIVSGVSGTVGIAAFWIALATGLFGFFLALGGAFAGEQPDSDTEQLFDVFLISLPIFLAAAAVWVVFYILYLVISCKVHYRVFALLGTPLPALWTFLGIFVSLLPSVLFFAYTRSSRRLRERFFPPHEEPDEASDTNDTPAEPPMPELYQL